MPRTMRFLVAAALGFCLLTEGRAQAPAQVRFAQPVTIGDGQRKLLASEAQRLGELFNQTSQQLKTMEAKNTPFSAMGETLSTRAGGEATNVTKARDAFLKMSGDNNVQRQAGQAFFEHFLTRCVMGSWLDKPKWSSRRHIRQLKTGRFSFSTKINGRTTPSRRPRL